MVSDQFGKSPRISLWFFVIRATAREISWHIRAVMRFFKQYLGGIGFGHSMWLVSCTFSHRVRLPPAHLYITARHQVPLSDTRLRPSPRSSADRILVMWISSPGVSVIYSNRSDRYSHLPLRNSVPARRSSSFTARMDPADIRQCFCRSNPWHGSLDSVQFHNLASRASSWIQIDRDKISPVCYSRSRGSVNKYAQRE
jgi:hypothetical protein